MKMSAMDIVQASAIDSHDDWPLDGNAKRLRLLAIPRCPSRWARRSRRRSTRNSRNTQNHVGSRDFLSVVVADPRRLSSVWNLSRAKNHMKKTAHARFAIKSWDEKPYNEGQDLPRLTRASVAKTFSGDLDGEGVVEYLMMYRSDGSATFVGLERVVGRID